MADLIPALEQTAILMALLSAYGMRLMPKKKDRSLDQRTGKQYAWEFFLGYLDHTTQVHGPRVVQTKELDSVKAKHPSILASKSSPRPADLLICPVDGMRTLLSGLNGGSVSAIAVGPQGHFDSLENLSDDYLILMSRGRPSLIDMMECLEAEKIVSKRPDDTRYLTTPSLDVARCLEDILRAIRGHAPKHWWTLATTVNEFDFCRRHVLPALQGAAIGRAYHGSSICGGLNPLFPVLAIDLYVGLARSSHVMMLAVAAASLGGQLIAIPVARTGRQPTVEKVLLDLHSPIRTVSDLLPAGQERSGSILLTGISENTLVRGIRLRDNWYATSHTLVLQGQSRSSRFVEHKHCLTDREFFLGRKTRLLERFLDVIQNELGESLHVSWL